ncbi:unnamed protein product [[Candida] boidinii]|nr:unnamed protein product [[Candida] boidinii]
MASMNKTTEGAKSIESLLKKPNGMAIPKPSAATTTNTATATSSVAPTPASSSSSSSSSSSLNNTTSTVSLPVDTSEKSKMEPLEDKKDSASVSSPSSSSIKKPQYYSRAATGAPAIASEPATPTTTSALVPPKPSTLPGIKRPSAYAPKEGATKSAQQISTISSVTTEKKIEVKCESKDGIGAVKEDEDFENILERISREATPDVGIQPPLNAKELDVFLSQHEIGDTANSSNKRPIDELDDSKITKLPKLE